MNEPQPISKISGNIEITFNTKGKDLDPYEPWMDQIVLTIGKSGRANRLTFNDLDSESIYGAAETLKEIADQVKDIEDMLEEAEEDDFDIDDIDTAEASRENKLLKETLDTIEKIESYEDSDSTSIKEISRHMDSQYDFEDIKDAVETLKRKGELFEPNSKEPMEVTTI